MTEQTTAIATTNGDTKIEKAGKGPRTLKSFLESPAILAKLAEVTTATMDPAALVRMALMAASRNQELAKCTQESILRSLLDAAELDIAPGGLQGRGYLVPRFNKNIGGYECNFDPGWRGLVDIARRSGLILSISAHVVYERDHFVVEFGLSEKIEHRPFLNGDRGAIVGAYAVAQLRDGAHQAEFLSIEDINKIGNSSASKGGPWANWFDEMARKSAVRRLCKYLPYEPKLEHAVRASLASDGADFDDLTSGVVESAGKAAALGAKLEHDADGVIPDKQ